MKALIYKNGQARYLPNYPVPVPGPGESLVRVTLAAICNTDREVLRGYKPDFTGVMGHEFVGVAEESSDKSLVGARVVGELNAGCGVCVYCRTGRERHCPERRVLGLTAKDGCFAEYMTIRTDLLHKIPDSVPDEAAVCCEPLAAALEIPERIHLPPSQAVAVVGDGRLAFMIAQVLALSGAKTHIFGRHGEKLRMFAAFAETHLSPGTGQAFETVVEASGSPSGLKDAFGLVRSCGTIVLKSTYAKLAEINLSEAVVREIALRGSRCGPFAPALELLRRGKILLPEIELHPLEEHARAFASGAFKAGFRPG